MKNSFFNSFVPKQPNFFCLLKQLADILSEAADVLTESVEQGKPEERETYYRRVKEVERKGDMVTHQVLTNWKRRSLLLLTARTSMLWPLV